MWIKRRGRQSQSMKFEKNQYGFPAMEFKQDNEWEEEIHFPYVEEVQPPKKEEKQNSFRNRLRTIGTTILIGLITNGIYDQIKSNQLLILFLSIKMAAILAAAWNYMASVFADLHVVIQSLF